MRLLFQRPDKIVFVARDWDTMVTSEGIVNGNSPGGVIRGHVVVFQFEEETLVINSYDKKQVGRKKG